MEPPKKERISLVVPFFNEGVGVQLFFTAITRVINVNSSTDFEVICVDDGSTDDTLERLITLTQNDDRFCIVELSRNFGKEAALTAGIDSATGDAIIPMDADLQDPPEMISDMIDEWHKGAEIVVAQRTDRSSDTFLKRNTAKLFYRIHNHMSDIKIPENVGDFRLMDRVAVNTLRQLPEQQRFMKGLFSWIGFKTTTITYKRNPRATGTTKFSGWKLWNFALEGITSFSTAPLKIWSYVGGVGAVLTFSYATFIASRTVLYGVDVPGYASLLVAILFLGSLQLIGIGVLGEYIGRIYMESKRRPTYIIRKRYNLPNNSDTAT